MDRIYGRVLAMKLAARLWERCKSERDGRFLTLTYRRDEYDGPQDLYRRSGEDRHVRRFIEDLAAYLGESLTGRWLCKLEFQKGGWVHWHLVVLGVGRIDHAVLTDMWGHGFVWVKRMTRSNVTYLTKYVAKDGELPAFLLLEPIRSVKVVRVSPGFWGDVPDDVAVDDAHGGDAAPRRRGRMPWYRSIGEAIEEAPEATVVRDKDVNKYAEVKAPMWEVWHRLRAMGARVTGTCAGWVTLEGITWREVVRACGAGWGEPGAPAREQRPPGAAERAGAPGPLHLRDGGNPPEGGDPYQLLWRRQWVRAYFTQATDLSEGRSGPLAAF
jgi:hypothetical protein